MTDDISKVVPPEAVPVKDDALNFGVVQAKDWVIPTACGVRVVDERMAYGWNECRKATIDRLESATTPAGVDGVVVSDDSIIARCEAAGIKWLEPDNVLPDGTIDLEGFPGSFDMATMQEMRALLTGSATLARQLAEAKAEIESWRDDYEALRTAANTKNDALKSRAVKAESQLAEATRRVGEVEGLVGKWRECAEDNAAKGELIQAGKAVAYTDCADELEAALKEPK